MSQKVFNGNNIELLKEYPDNYFDAIVTDPPYGLGKEPNAEQMLQAWITDGYLEVKGSGFMGKEWDAFVPQPIFWKEVFRVLKHGGHVLSFFGTRTYDWGVIAMRLAGFEVRDCIQWVYGSGFPKSYNIAKGIEGKLTVGSSNTKEYKLMQGDKSVTKLGTFNRMEKEQGVKPNDCTGTETTINHILTTKEAKEWDGWGSALKPANEPIVLARKPLEKGLSIAENVLKWGTGGINIDGCRVGFTDNVNLDAKQKTNNLSKVKFFDEIRNDLENPIETYKSNGRFPANFIISHHSDCVCVGTKKVKSDAHHTHKYNNKKTLYDGSWKDGEDMGNKFADENGQETIENWNCHEDCPIRIMDEQSGVLNKQGVSKTDNKSGWQNEYVGGNEVKPVERKLYLDKGGASRFFYCAKASKKERNKGLDQFEEKPLAYSNQAKAELKRGNEKFDGNNSKGHGNSIRQLKNFHPTVKPISLMRYLVRLITPPNGIVLDPFNGSGTTGIACKLEGINYVGMELDADYCKIAQARIDNFTESDLEYEVEELNEDAQTNESEQKDNEDDNLDTQLSLF